MSGFVRQTVSIGRPDTGTEEDASWGIAIESPVEIVVNGEPWTVLLATPADLGELAVGLLLTERVVTDVSAVQQVEITALFDDVRVSLTVDPAAMAPGALRARALASNTGCGLCGIESLAALQAREAPQPKERLAITPTAVLRAFDALPALQPLNRVTRSVHAAAWCTLDGEITLVREDVGRHNALDKLVGTLAARGELATPGFVVMSSRCSYELVYKATVTNAQLLATISAPTTLALRWADALALPLASLSRDRRAGEGGVSAIVRFPLEMTHADG
jgi:FdhD protein